MAVLPAMSLIRKKANSASRGATATPTAAAAYEAPLIKPARNAGRPQASLPLVVDGGAPGASGSDYSGPVTDQVATSALLGSFSNADEHLGWLPACTSVASCNATSSPALASARRTKWLCEAVLCTAAFEKAAVPSRTRGTPDWAGRPESGKGKHCAGMIEAVAFW